MMKIVTLFLFAGCLQLSAKSSAQGISLSLNNASLSAAFSEIQQQTSFRFIYTNEQLVASSKISITVQNVSLDKVLQLCFKDQPLTYFIEDKFIIVKPKDKPIVPVNSVENEIRGKVMNETGDPVPGATIILKGSQKATASDNRGEFVLADVPAGSVIVVSSVGYESTSVIIGNNRVLSIHLQTAVSALDEMVIKGYYNTSKRLNTGSVSKLSAEEISRQPVSNVLAAAEGRMPGVYIQQGNGVPGSSYNIQIRGQNSLRNLFSNNGNLPLYIVDGVPYSATPLGTSTTSGIIQGGNPLSNISPSDIESLEILKDADATAIYGSRGANGVILITTKKGSGGDMVINAAVSYGIGKVGHRMEMLQTPDYLKMRKEAFKNDAAVPNPVLDYDLLSWDSTRNNDWQNELIGGSAQISNVEGSVSGGSKNLQYLIGGAYYRETTVFPGDFSDKKGSFHVNLTATSNNKKLSIAFSANYMADNNKLLQTDLTSASLRLAPNAPNAFSSDGKLNWQPGFTNPYGAVRQRYKGVTNNLIGNAVITYNLLPGLVLKTNMGFTDTKMDERNIIPLSSFNPANGGTSGYTYFGNTAVRSWIVEPQVEYSVGIFRGQLKTLVGTTFNEQKRNFQVLDAENFAQDNLLENLAAAGSIFVLDGDNSVYRYNSVFLRTNYNYKDKYLVNLTGRRDGSSRFGPGKTFANFGAIGLAWIFSKEKIFKNPGLLSYGKLRGSFGITGNDQIGDYKYLSTWSPTTYPYQNSGLYPTALLNPDYSWETNKKLEIAIELGFLKDRILFSAGFYKNKSSNQLVGFALPLTTGFSSVQANLPAVVQNTGLEFELNTRIIKNNNFSWSTSFNITFPRNRLVSYPNIATSGYAYTYSVGKSLFIQQKFHYIGVDSQTGVYQFEDVQNKSLTSTPVYPSDLKALYSITQDYYGGVNNSIIYKDWQLDIFLQFVKQTGGNYWRANGSAPGMRSNQPSVVMERWQKPGDVTNIQRFTQTVGSAAYYAYNIGSSDYYITDASFIRLKNVSLSYNFPDAVKRGLHLHSGSIFIRGQNLFTITNYFGLDPENQSTSRLPPLRVIMAGFKITI